MDNFEGECALVFRREKSKKLLTFQAVSFVKIAAVIEIKKDGIPDWKIKKTSAKKSNFGDFGNKIISNYGRAVHRAKQR